MPDFQAEMIAIGVLGGFLPDLIRFAKGRHKKIPEWARRPDYWVQLLVLLFLGGLAAWLGSADEAQAAIAMGFAAPEFITRLAGGSLGDEAGGSLGDESAGGGGVLAHDGPTRGLRQWWRT